MKDASGVVMHSDAALCMLNTYTPTLWYEDTIDRPSKENSAYVERLGRMRHTRISDEHTFVTNNHTDTQGRASDGSVGLRILTLREAKG